MHTDMLHFSACQGGSFSETFQKFYQNITKYTQRCFLNFHVKKEVLPKHYKVHTEKFFGFPCQGGNFDKTLQSTQRFSIDFHVKVEILPKHYKAHTEMFFRFPCQGDSFTKTLQSTHTQMFLSYITKHTQ